MVLGMLWFSNDKNSTLQQKVMKARDYYVKKYGRTPNLCMVNPSVFEPMEIEGLTIKAYRPVLPGHLWIGIEEDK